MHWLLLLILIPYVYIILKISAALIKVKPYLAEKESEIFVSVIVACRNEERNLPFLLSDIAGQNYNPDNYELIIVDDNSSDSTFETASGYNGMRNLKVLRNKEQGKKKAVRRGIEESSGTLILTTDADSRIGKDWIKTTVSFQARNNPQMIISPVKLENRRGFLFRFQELDFLSLQGITAGTAAMGNPVMCNGANLAFLKDTYNKYAENLHDELVSGDDVFLLHNIKREHEKRILWLESYDATVITRASENLISFLNQRARWISKAGHYNDSYTKLLGIVTFVTICFQAFLTVAVFFKPFFLTVLVSAILIKSIPDFIILRNTIRRYKGKRVLKWFFPSQIVYPFYVLAVVFLSFRHKGRW